MATELYRRIIQRYQPLVAKVEGERIVPTQEWIDRSYAICLRFTPQHKGGAAPDDNCPVYDEAARLIRDEGMFIDPADLKGQLTDSFVQRYAYTEIDALVYTASLIVADTERENGRPFQDENLEPVMMKAMQELYVGKNALQSQENRLTTGRLF